MPTYDYSCLDCNKNFTKFQSITSEPFVECPTCAKPIRRNVSSGTGIHFKGSGFYVTDYKKSRQQSENLNDNSNKKDNSKQDSNKQATSATSTTQAASNHSGSSAQPKQSHNNTSTTTNTSNN